MILKVSMAVLYKIIWRMISQCKRASTPVMDPTRRYNNWARHIFNTHKATIILFADDVSQN